MGHYAAEMGYETPEERNLRQEQYYREMEEIYRQNEYQPTVGDEADLTQEGFHSLGMSFYYYNRFQIVKRIKFENNKAFISFLDEDQAQKTFGSKTPLQALVADMMGNIEWYDAKHFRKI